MLQFYRNRKNINYFSRIAVFTIIFCVSPLTVKAQTPLATMLSVPQFVPSSGWQVQSTPLSKLRGLEKMNLPCMMAVSYDNGYIVRFSGNQGQMLAMAIDFRQNVFTQGRKYPATLNINGTYNKAVQATAFSPSTLIFNLRDLDGFYIALSDAVKMELNVEDNPMLFALGGINNAMKQLEGCASSGQYDQSPIRQAALPPQQKARGWQQPVQQAPRAPQQNRASSTQNWQAKAGENVRDTLERWSNKAGVKLDWQATNAGTVASDLSIQGTFEDAVQMLMAQNATALGLDANMQGQNARPASINSASVNSSMASAPQPLMPAVSQPSINNSGMTPLPSRLQNRQVAATSIVPSNSMGSARWTAPVGASLQQILKNWSNKANAELIWESDQGFSVLQPINVNGSYEEALQSLLNQYSTLRIRPAANLNNDPVTGRKTLFVQSSRVL